MDKYSINCLEKTDLYYKRYVVPPKIGTAEEPLRLRSHQLKRGAAETKLLPTNQGVAGVETTDTTKPNGLNVKPWLLNVKHGITSENSGITCGIWELIVRVKHVVVHHKHMGLCVKYIHRMGNTHTEVFISLLGPCIDFYSFSDKVSVYTKKVLKR